MSSSAPPYFVLPLYSRDTTQSLRASKIKPKRRRPIEDDETEPELSDASRPGSPGAESVIASSGAVSGLTALNTPPSSQKQPSPPRLRPRPVEPFDSEEEPPPYPFPHRARSPRVSSATTKAKTLEDLAQLNPPIYLPNASYLPTNTERSSLGLDKPPRRHLNILITIIHRCLNEGDYERAKAAYALLLRSIPRNKDTEGIDVRKDWYWAIGVELLLRTGNETSVLGVQEHQQPVQSELSEAQDEAEAAAPKTMSDTETYNSSNLSATKAYLERLSLEYSHDKTLKKRIDERLFRTTLFTTWIYVASSEPDFRAQRREARSILEKMRDLQLNPPFSDDVVLCRLRADVSSWLADLEEQTATALQEEETSRLDGSDSDSKSDSDSGSDSDRQGGRRQNGREKEVHMAHERAEEAREDAREMREKATQIERYQRENKQRDEANRSRQPQHGGDGQKTSSTDR